MGDADPPGGSREARDDTAAGASNDGLPGVDFNTLVLSLSHSALLHLGDAPDPDGGRLVSLPLARQTIDLLALLQEKTKNNLDGQEERLLEQALFDLRLRYVEVSTSQPR
jgi:Domain of unknown function (DUF1844)